jgi:hypothetical protein
MHQLEVLTTRKRTMRFSFPGAWEECTPQQLGVIAALLSAGHDTTEDREQCHLRLRLLHELSGMPDKVFCRIAPEDLLGLRSDELGIDRVALLPELDWALKPPAWERSLVPCLSVNGTRFSGPTDRLAHMTLLQWGFCDQLMQRLGRLACPEALHELLGALYHPTDSTWDHEHIEERAAQLAGVDDPTKLGAVLNYTGLRAWLSARYPRCFKGAQQDPHGIQGMVVRMAGPKFGTVQQTYHANLHDVMVHVEQAIEDAERTEQLTQT